MSALSSLCIPFFILFVIIFALFRRVNVWSAFLDGAKNGLKCAVEILPSLFGLVVAIEMLSASGALDALSSLAAPITRFIGIPGEIFPLTLMRSISGGGATAVFRNILTLHGADSYLGRCAAVIMGSTETTFYTIAVYFAATRVKNIRYTLFCALLADLTGSIVGCIICRFLFD
ncbi:MAG: spore maturation protein [Clostridia bacterium]|nr:spore maturation protein [Clostridia bacterium]